MSKYHSLRLDHQHNHILGGKTFSEKLDLKKSNLLSVRFEELQGKKFRVIRDI